MIGLPTCCCLCTEGGGVACAAWTAGVPRAGPPDAPWWDGALRLLAVRAVPFIMCVHLRAEEYVVSSTQHLLTRCASLRVAWLLPLAQAWVWSMLT